MEAEVAMASNSSSMSFPGTFAKDIRLTPFYSHKIILLIASNLLNKCMFL